MKSNVQLKELLRNTRFSSKIKRFYQKNEDKILDIVLFGSAVKGKERPGDIDILVVYKLKKEDLETSQALGAVLKKEGFNVSITSKTYGALFDASFLAREAYLSEAYSFVTGKFVAEGLGYGSFVLFRYELKGMSKSDRMRFYYSIYGRQKEGGVLRQLGARKFSGTIISVPTQNSEQAREFFEHWKISCVEIPVLIPLRIITSRQL